MRTTDIIRSVLDLIDQIEQVSDHIEDTEPEEIVTGIDQNRYKQIIDFLTAEYDQMYDNSPAEVVAGIQSVTTDAGGGWNGPKNPADIRGNSISMFPNFQATKE